MSRTSYVFTSESVSEGHPDKVSDRISDTIVDLFMAKDPEARVACETLTTTNRVVLAGEIRGKGIWENGAWAPGVEKEIEDAVRAAVKDIGYEQDGFHWKTLTFEITCTASPPTSPWASTPPTARTRARATRASCSATPRTRPPS